MTITEEITRERNRIETEIASPFCSEYVRAEGLEIMAKLRIMEIEAEGSDNL